MCSLHGHSKIGYENAQGAYLEINTEDIFSTNVSAEEIQEYEDNYEKSGKIYEHPTTERVEEVQKNWKENFSKIENRKLGASIAYSEYIENAYNEYKVDKMLIRSIVQVESSGNPLARSEKGAVGLMQMTEVAIREVNDRYKTDYTIEDMTDPQKNVMAGTAYFKILQEEYFFGKDEKFVIAAYNAGPTIVNQLIGGNSEVTYEDIAEDLPKETRDYVAKVTNHRDTYQRIQEFTRNNPDGTCEWKDAKEVLVDTGIIRLSSSGMGLGEDGKSREFNRTCIDGLRGSTLEGMRLLSEKL